MIAILFKYYFVICLFQTFPPGPQVTPLFIYSSFADPSCAVEALVHGGLPRGGGRRVPLHLADSGPSQKVRICILCYILNLTFQTNHDIWHWDIWQPGRGCGVPASDLGLQIRLPQRVAWWAEIILQPTAANNYLHSCHTQASPTATRGCSSSWVCSWPTRPGVSRYKCEGLSAFFLSICLVVSCRC